MTIGKRLLVLATVVAALAVPAAALADDGGGGSPTTGARPAHAVRVFDWMARGLDRRFQVFSKRCIVQNAPAKCAAVADRYVTGLGKLQTGLQKLEAKLAEKCGVANPPARCKNAGQVKQAIDNTLAKISSEISAIKAAFPSAGS